MEEFRGFKSISNIKSGMKKHSFQKYVTHKTNSSYSEKTIAKVFAKFTEKIYAKGKQDEEEWIEDEMWTVDHKVENQ